MRIIGSLPVMMCRHLLRVAWVIVALVGVIGHASAQVPASPRHKSQQARPAVTAAAAVATQVSWGGDERGPALVIDLSSEVRAHQSVMIEPNRLILDLPGVRFHGAVGRISEKDPFASQMRAGAFMRGSGRIVLDLKRPLKMAEQRFMPLDGGGVRLVITLEPIENAAFLALAHPVSDDIVTGTTSAKAQPASGAELPLVFLDPGHGGIDSGATGPAGELEKAIVLQFSLALKDRLERGGKARVAMSRTTDVFVPLRDRVRMARQAKAQLFISLHADALPDEGEARGASVYTLSERATDERSQRLADKENRADLAAGIDLKDDQDEVADILFDLARRESRAFSVQFARQLVGNLPKATRMHKTPLRGAGFRVLRAPDVPSVLLELGYLTTPDEAKMMQTDEWRRATADAAADAIERFLTERIAKELDKP